MDHEVSQTDQPNGVAEISSGGFSAESTPVEVCGYQINPFSHDQLVQYVLDRVAQKKGGWILALNLDLVARGIREPEFATLIKRATVTVADGQPLVWGAKKKNPALKDLERATGSDLTQALLHKVSPANTAIIGGKDPKLALTKEGLNPSDPWFVFDGFVKLDEEFIESLYGQIKNRTLVFVALGVPKQEKLIDALMAKMPETTFIGVGGSFEFLAGYTSRAPKWMQRNGLEWFYRLCTEPRRLWKRYLIDYIPGGLALLKDMRNSKR